MSRFLLTYSPAYGLIFLWDAGEGLPDAVRQAWVPAQENRAAEVPVVHLRPPAPSLPVLVADDFRPNEIACSCDKCKRRIMKGQGYKRLYRRGFLCEFCQYEEDLPTRSDAARAAAASA